MKQSMRLVLLVVCFLGFYLNYAEAGSPDWQVQFVAENSGFGHGSTLSLNKKSESHISYLQYENLDLMHATYDGLKWSYQMVESDGDVGWAVCQAIDVFGNPHICYYDDTQHVLKYAHLLDGEWAITTIGSALNSHAYIVLDEKMTPHLVYTTVDSPERLVYAVKRPSGWETQVVEYGSFNVPVIAVDREGNIHLTYNFKAPQKGLKYAFYDKNSWQIEVLDHAETFTSALRVDSECRPVVTYTYYVTEPYDDLIYAVRDKGIWERQTVGHTGMIFWRNHGMMLDDSDRPHLVYADAGGEERELTYAMFDGADWHYETIELFSEIGGACISMAEDGTVGVLYSVIEVEEGGTWDLYYASHKIPMWSFETVTDNGRLGPPQTLGFDTKNRPHGVYHRAETDTDLLYMWKDLSGWEFQTIDMEGITGLGQSLVVDQQGENHVGYYDDTQKTVKYAVSKQGKWTIETIGPADQAQTTIALDKSGEPHIAYTTDQPKPGLRYAGFKDQSWSSETVDEGVFGDPGLCLDAKQLPHLVYIVLDEDYPGLRHAWWGGEIWNSEQIFNGRVQASSCTIDKLGGLQVSFSYVDQTGKMNLMYASRTVKDGSWIFEPVTVLGETGGALSLALDQYGNPLIGYPVESGGDLHLEFAYRNKIEWNFESFADLSHDLEGISMAVNGKGSPGLLLSEISEKGENNIFYAQRFSEPCINPEIDLIVGFEMPVMVSPGDAFSVDGIILNPGPAVEDALVFFILGAGDNFWMWPSWQKIGEGDLEFSHVDIPAGESTVEVVPEFTWPETGSSASNLAFYGGVMTEAMVLVISNIAIHPF